MLPIAIPPKSNKVFRQKLLNSILYIYSPKPTIQIAKNAKSDYGVEVTEQLGRINPCNSVDKLNHVWYSIVKKRTVPKLIFPLLLLLFENIVILKVYLLLL